MPTGAKHASHSSAWDYDDCRCTIGIDHYDDGTPIYIHYIADIVRDTTACGSYEGDSASSNEADVTCPDCKSVL